MNDGAQMGISASDALAVIIGGKNPDDAPRITTSDMLKRVKSRTFADADPESGGTYEGCTEYCAKLILDWYAEDPTRIKSDPDPYDAMKASGIDLAVLGVSGFMWGWAVNFARACLEMPSLPNPAIVTVSWGDDL